MDAFKNFFNDMMKTADRDLLVISKNALANENALQEEVEFLNGLLQHVEALPNIACSAEIFDLNRNKRINNNRGVIENQLKEKQLKPFVFICNRN